ncbi:hypothetical protein ALC60_02109 [Trachymyrmex zeteki]|uniref:Uncharacterized protein n=1 Tax=Mycetomoellerius zeteki TaxID=64791 RepID=A0A151XEZ6_9HYME|nr:hypothetical protein ALC60_02109 [Trachymyrmex zeteki]
MTLNYFVCELRLLEHHVHRHQLVGPARPTGGEGTRGTDHREGRHPFLKKGVEAWHQVKSSVTIGCLQSVGSRGSEAEEEGGGVGGSEGGGTSMCCVLQGAERVFPSVGNGGKHGTGVGSGKGAGDTPVGAQDLPLESLWAAGLDEGMGFPQRCSYANQHTTLAASSSMSHTSPANPDELWRERNFPHSCSRLISTIASSNQISGILLIGAIPCHGSTGSTGYISASRDDAKIIILDRSGRNYSVASWKIGRAIVVRLVVTSSLVCLETIVNRYSAFYHCLFTLSDPEIYYRPGKNDEQCECRKGRLPDLTSDMCRLLSYRSLNGLVRNHRLDGDKDRKRRRDEEGRSSTVAVEVKSKGCVLDLPSCSSAHVDVALCKSRPEKKSIRAGRERRVRETDIRSNDFHKIRTDFYVLLLITFIALRAFLQDSSIYMARGIHECTVQHFARTIILSSWEIYRSPGKWGDHSC